MPTFHTEEELIAYAKSLPKSRYADGLSIHEWKRQRRLARQAKKRINFRVWPDEMAKRFDNVMEHFGNEHGEQKYEIAVERLEAPPCCRNCGAWISEDERELGEA